MSKAIIKPSTRSHTYTYWLTRSLTRRKPFCLVKSLFFLVQEFVLVASYLCDWPHTLFAIQCQVTLRISTDKRPKRKKTTQHTPKRKIVRKSQMFPYSQTHTAVEWEKTLIPAISLVYIFLVKRGKKTTTTTHCIYTIHSWPRFWHIFLQVKIMFRLDMSTFQYCFAFISFHRRYERKPKWKQHEN